MMDKLIAFVVANKAPITMFVLLTITMLVRRFAPVETEVLEYLEGLWMVLGFGAVFTPNFKRAPKDPP